MEETMLERLARTLGVPPAMIERYRPEGDGRYTVLLVDFRKATAVLPEPAEEAAASQPAATAPEADGLPEDLRTVYERPLSGRKAQLVALARLLGLPATGTRKQLAAAIDAHRAAIDN